MGIQIQPEGGALTQQTLQALANIEGSGQVLQSASGAINPHQSANYIITKAGVAALTLVAPTAGVDDGVVIRFTSVTANAHTVTATALLDTGVTGSPFTTALFAAFPGAGFSVMAYNGLWYLINLVGTTVTFS